MTTFICKVQRPVVGQAALVLVYNEDRSVTRQEFMEADDVNKLFERGEYKNYRYCEIRRTKLYIGQRAPSQAW
jgi:hypothetical protein